MRICEAIDIKVGGYVWYTGEGYMHSWDCPGIIKSISGDGTFIVQYFDDLKEMKHESDKWKVLKAPTTYQVRGYLIEKRSRREKLILENLQKIEEYQSEIEQYKKLEGAF